MRFLGLLQNLRNSNLFYGTLPLKVNSFHKILRMFLKIFSCLYPENKQIFVEKYE